MHYLDIFIESKDGCHNSSHFLRLRESPPINKMYEFKCRLCGAELDELVVVDSIIKKIQKGSTALAGFVAGAVARERLYWKS